MNEIIKQKWVAALRSGEYKQGRGYLRTKQNAFCCLGVLEDLHIKENGENLLGWQENGEGFTINGNECYLSHETQEWAGIKDSNPVPNNSDLHSLAGLNDQGKTFAEIADIIEKGM